MYVEQVGFFGQFMVVQFYDCDVVGMYCLDDFLNFGGDQDEIVVDCCVIVVYWLKIDYCCQVQ